MPKQYIELDAALAALGEEPYVWVDYSEALTQEHNDWECHYNAISAIPAADVEKVVRCGQCKHCEEHYDTDGNAPYWTCKEWDSGTDYDGYCHYGERKDGVQDDV